MTERVPFMASVPHVYLYNYIMFPTGLNYKSKQTVMAS